MKIVFQNIFKDSNKAQELFNLNPNYFKQFYMPNSNMKVESWQNLKSLEDDGLLSSHSILNFIQ